VLFAVAGLIVAGIAYSALTVSVSEPSGGCYLPAEGSRQGDVLKEGKAKAGFNLRYPCQLPAGQTLTSISVVGQTGRQSATLNFDGPFDMTIRQSQIPPALSADPAGSSHVVIDLFPSIKAQLIERNDGSRKAEYHLVWSQDAIFFDLLADGPPLSREQILKAARSLQ
jgi:hypothetical protein